MSTVSDIPANGRTHTSSTSTANDMIAGDCKESKFDCLNLHNHLALIERLGHTLFTHDQDLLLQHAEEVCKAPKPDEVVQEYIKLVLSTRAKLEDNPELDALLVTAASNAISILNYGSLCGLFPFRFDQVRNWSGCRIPGACLNMAVLEGCDFSHADLSNATLFSTHARNCNFRCANMRQARTFQSHDLAVMQPLHAKNVAFSNDSRTVAVSDGTGCVHVWNTRTHERITTIRMELVDTVTFSQDGVNLVVGNPRGQIQLWDVTAGLCAARSAVEVGGILCLTTSPDGTRLISASQALRIDLWDMSQPPVLKHLNSIRVPAVTNAVAFTPDGSKFVSAHLNSTVCLWDVETCALLDTLSVALKGSPLRIVFDDAGTKLAVYIRSYRGPFVRFLNLDGTTLSDAASTIEVNESSIIFLGTQSSSDSGSSSATTVNTLCETSNIKVWNLITELDYTTHLPFLRLCVAGVSPDGTSFLSFHQRENKDDEDRARPGVVRICDTQMLTWSMNLYRHVVTSNLTELPPQRVMHIALSHDGQRLALPLGDTCCVWELAASDGSTRVVSRSSNAFHSVAFSRDDRTVFGAALGHLYAWNLDGASNNSAPNERLYTRDAYHLVCSSDGLRIATIGDAEGSLQVMNLETGQVEEFPSSAPTWNVALTFSSDGSQLAILMDTVVDDGDTSNFEARFGGVRVIDIGPPRQVTASSATDRQQRQPHRKRAYTDTGRIAFSSDDRQLVVCSDDTKVEIWIHDRTTQQCSPRLVLAGGYSVSCAAFIANDAYIITGGVDGFVRLWDASSGECKLAVDCGHEIEHVSISLDETLLVTAAHDRELPQLWRMRWNWLEDGGDWLSYLSAADGTSRRLSLRWHLEGNDFTDARMDSSLHAFIRSDRELRVTEE